MGRRACLRGLVLVALGAAGCSRPGPSPDASALEVTRGPQGSVGESTYQVVIQGPGEKPVASADVAPRVLREEPSVLQVLETSLPAMIIADYSQYEWGERLILTLSIAGAAANRIAEVRLERLPAKAS
jgi:hypothetical protein